MITSWLDLPSLMSLPTRCYNLSCVSACVWPVPVWPRALSPLHSHLVKSVKRASSFHASSHSTRTRSRVSRMAVTPNVSSSFGDWLSGHTHTHTHTHHTDHFTTCRFPHISSRSAHTYIQQGTGAGRCRALLGVCSATWWAGVWRTDRELCVSRTEHQQAVLWLLFSTASLDSFKANCIS